MEHQNVVSPDDTLNFPRIICLHGGGSNAEVFYAQMRTLRSKLEAHFRLVFVDAPFICPAGPGVAMVYQHLSPFRRWLRWLPEHPKIDGETAVREIDDAIWQAVEEDTRIGAKGECVGLLGFSQGATVSAMICAGRAPLVQFSPRGDHEAAEHLGDAADRTTVFTDWPSRDDPPEVKENYMLRMPTVHVHGSRDEGLPLHRKLLESYCAPGSTELVQWCGDHRLPLKSYDVEAVVEQVVNVARMAGCFDTD
ncbi:hypothetical protein KEM54_003498 [Ascosphaera aggregata]|nr:hypothetical protein KEM54_003498 [Ascosphaera aggregata]